MNEQTVQSLLFLAMVGAMIVLSLIDSFVRRQQRRQQMEQMEEEERRGGGVAMGRAEPEAIEPGRWIPPEEYELWEEEAPEHRQAPRTRRTPEAREIPEPWEIPEPRDASRGPEEAARTREASGPRESRASRASPPTEIAAEAERLRRESRRELETGAETPRIEEVEAPKSAFPSTGRRRRRKVQAPALRRAVGGDVQALQDAVLYREILGRPLGSRPGPGGWEDSAG